MNRSDRGRLAFSILSFCISLSGMPSWCNLDFDVLLSLLPHISGETRLLLHILNLLLKVPQAVVFVVAE